MNFLFFIHLLPGKQNYVTKKVAIQAFPLPEKQYSKNMTMNFAPSDKDEFRHLWKKHFLFPSHQLLLVITQFFIQPELHIFFCWSYVCFWKL